MRKNTKKHICTKKQMCFCNRQRKKRLDRKPGSVSNDDLSCPCVTARLTPSPGRARLRIMSHTDVASSRVYIAAKSPVRWWALTSPFHPYRFRGGFFLLHYPWGHPRLPLAVTLSLW